LAFLPPATLSSFLSFLACYGAAGTSPPIAATFFLRDKSSATAASTSSFVASPAFFFSLRAFTILPCSVTDALAASMSAPYAGASPLPFGAGAVAALPFGAAAELAPGAPHDYLTLSWNLFKRQNHP
jgi:hypothetical protein